MRKKIFAQKASLFFTMVIMLIVIGLVMILGRYSRWGEVLENKLSIIAWPLQEMVALPMSAFKNLSQTIRTHQDLIARNNQLQSDNFMLRTQLQQLTALENQNKDLTALLGSAQMIKDQVQVAQILAIRLNPALEQMIVNVGSDSQAYQNQPVLDAFGVMGQLVTIMPKVSRLLLLTDPKSAIAVKDARSNVRAVAVGAGYGKLELINVTDTADIQPSDLIMTSGLGLQFPTGYPVGIVQKVVHTPDQNFAQIILKPSAHLEQSDQVLLVWPKQKALADEVNKTLAMPLQKNEPLR
jgi:rod shape-determining protein MreC